MTKIELGAWIAENTQSIRDKTSFPLIEIHAIVSHILAQPREWIITHPENALSEAQISQLNKAVRRLLDGEPLAYITNKRSFFGSDFFIDQRVLVPRPETELLVELAIDWLKENPECRSVIDTGTGSGIIAISITNEIPDARVIAVDVSADALEVANINVRNHGLQNRITLKRSDLLDGVDEPADLIVANLPYIPSDAPEISTTLRHEPRLALDGGEDGLRSIAKLIDQSAKMITPGGCAILEIQYNHGIAVMEMAARRFPRALISLHRDLASIPRVVRIQLSNG